MEDMNHDGSITRRLAVESTLHADDAERLALDMANLVQRWQRRDRSFPNEAIDADAYFHDETPFLWKDQSFFQDEEADTRSRPVLPKVQNDFDNVGLPLLTNIPTVSFHKLSTPLERHSVTKNRCDSATVTTVENSSFEVDDKSSDAISFSSGDDNLGFAPESHQRRMRTRRRRTLQPDKISRMSQRLEQLEEEIQDLKEAQRPTTFAVLYKILDDVLSIRLPIWIYLMLLLALYFRGVLSFNQTQLGSANDCVNTSLT
jgi:hypothetical protein